MKIYLSQAIFHNRAPFSALDVKFEQNEIAILTAVNGRGKTTFLSHIVDAFHEMARPFFHSEYAGRENQFYRLSNNLENLDFKKPSIVYLRFALDTGDFVDYVNFRGELTQAEYDEVIALDQKIPFSELDFNISGMKFAKRISSNFNQKKAEDLFESNIITYFPAYRYEVPAFLNDPYKIELSFRKNNPFSGMLNNPIEVVSGLPQLANWLMDIVLDKYNTPGPDVEATWNNLNEVVTKTISSKNLGPLRFGVGPRGFGSTRIQIMQSTPRGEGVYPSIFGISSGESAVLCLFGELIRQADVNKGMSLSNISGIVLVDEIDKHLHIKLQKEVLPSLLILFPNLQFILSSHSPFLSMGLAETALDRTKIIDLETFGISKDPTTNALYSEVYKMMVGENDRFKDLYASLSQAINVGVVPLVVTEGMTDAQHLRAAKRMLNIENCDVEFFEAPGDWGDSKLKLLLEQLSKIHQSRRIIGIFDRDVPKIVDEIESNGRTYKAYGNNVYAFCLPIPRGREAYKNISIEFFYNDVDLRAESAGRRLYFDNEVATLQVQSNKAAKKIIKLDEPDGADENTKKIFDENVGTTSWIHSKATFSRLVENDLEFSKGFDFSNFQLIFSRLKEVLALA